MPADLFAAIPQATGHRCLGCGQHHPDAREVTLVDGTTASSYSEAWRLECEARSVLAIPTLAKRQEHLARIEKARGQRAADQLRDTMLVVWNAGRRKNCAARNFVLDV